MTILYFLFLLNAWQQPSLTWRAIESPRPTEYGYVENLDPRAANYRHARWVINVDSVDPRTEVCLQPAKEPRRCWTVQELRRLPTTSKLER